MSVNAGVRKIQARDFCSMRRRRFAVGWSVRPKRTPRIAAGITVA